MVLLSFWPNNPNNPLLSSLTSPPSSPSDLYTCLVLLISLHFLFSSSSLSLLCTTVCFGTLCIGIWWNGAKPDQSGHGLELVQYPKLKIFLCMVQKLIFHNPFSSSTFKPQPNIALTAFNLLQLTTLSTPKMTILDLNCSLFAITQELQQIYPFFLFSSGGFW